MNNVQRLAKHLAQTGAENLLIHSIHGTQTWIVCEKIGDDNWVLTLMEPEKNTSYNLGTVTEAQHLTLWYQLIAREVESRAKAIATFRRAAEFRSIVKKFISIDTKYGKETPKTKSHKVRR